MLKPATATLLLTVNGCALSVTSEAVQAYCDRQEPRNQAHAALLASEGTEALQVSGRNVIAPNAAFCGWR